VVAPFCSWLKEKSSRFLCENSCSYPKWLLNYLRLFAMFFDN
jgi:hypothetical protein